VTDYASITSHLPDDITITDQADHDASLSAAVRMGIGITTMQALMSATIDGARNPIKTNYEGCMSILHDSWGERAQDRMTVVNEYFNEVLEHWPGVDQWLQNTGLGNDPTFIRKAYQLAKQRYK
jgi:hypothetical protein